jgi:hypothetical protein
MITLLLKELGTTVNGASFAAGALAATAALVSLWLICAFIKRHWKTVLIVSAATGGLGLLLLGLRGGF